MDKPETFEVMICWSRWTVGIAWNFVRSIDKTRWQFELSIELPVVALSVFLENK